MLASLASAQFNQLATDRTGSRVVFSSRLNLSQETPNELPKIMEWTARDGVRTLFSEVVDPTGVRGPRNFPILLAPELGADGTRLVFTGERWCAGGSGCIGYQIQEGRLYLDPAFEPEKRAGYARISANGRWALWVNSRAFLPPVLTRVDLLTGKSDDGGGLSFSSALSGGRVVADDGTLVYPPQGNVIVIRRPALAEERITVPFNVRSAIISTRGDLVVAASFPDDSFWLVDLATSQSLQAVAAVEGCHQPVLSDDGTKLLFLSAANWEARNDGVVPQAWLMDLRSGALRQLTAHPHGIAEATISGDGEVVYASAVDGSLQRFDLRAGETSVLTATTPYVENWPTFPVDYAQGSRYEMFVGWSPQVALTWKGRDVPVVSHTGGSIEFIPPWDAEQGTGTIELRRASDSTLLQHLPVRIVELLPQFREAFGYVAGLREDGSPLTGANPARPGETITVFLTGLGQLDSARQPVHSFDLTWFDGVQPSTLPVLDVRLDPGTPGTYALQFRVPFGTPATIPSVAIRVAGEAYSRDTASVPVALSL